MANFKNEIIAFYYRDKREMPWRQTKKPYNIWVSEVILQQTRVAQGIAYYNAFIEAFPDIKALAAATHDEIFKIWQGLGYYTRARNMKASADYIVKKLHGEFPDNYADLIKLKGVGEYTAAAIASIAFNQPVAAVDGNVSRVLARFFGVEIAVDTVQGKKIIAALASENLDRCQPGLYNQALMEFGALVCTPNSPKCQFCPLSLQCLALAEGSVLRLPLKMPKRKPVKRYFNYFVFTDYTNIVIHQRTKSDIWKGLYEFPLIESFSELIEVAANNISEILQRLGMSEKLYISQGSYTITDISPVLKHKLTHQQLFCRFVTIVIPDLNLKDFSPVYKVVNFDELIILPVPVLIQSFISGSFLFKRHI